jgi:hypothetical protein
VCPRQRARHGSAPPVVEGHGRRDDVRGAWQCRHQLDRRARHDPGRACLVGKGRWPAAEDQRFPMSQGPGADQRYGLMTPKPGSTEHQ